MSHFCTLHRHESLEAARLCREAQLRASADMKLMLAGMPPKPRPLLHRPARKEVRKNVTIYVFSEAAPRAHRHDPGDEADTEELMPVAVPSPGQRRPRSKVPRQGQKSHAKLPRTKAGSKKRRGHRKR
ncbi:MAG: hypothetical protein JST92_13320 [Deltaproteobacteria bacterium]|nr:hypothetical protein [Deltaproteobacteria bacterium]